MSGGGPVTNDLSLYLPPCHSHPDHGPPPPQLYTQVILGLIIPGVGLTTVLLALYGYTAWNPLSRRYLDRVSFRLLTYALVAHVCFGITFSIAVLTVYPGRGCALLLFLSNVRVLASSPWKSSMTRRQQLTGVFSPGIFFCIAINLPLVLVFNVNGRKMEKYYVGGITMIALVPNLASYASGNLGWDEVNQSCWYHSKDPSVMLRWLVVTQSVWFLLASFGEVVSFMVIIGYLVVYGLFSEDTLSSYASTASRRPGSTILRFRNIILRIGLYPLVSCILNVSATVLGLYMFENHRLKHEPQLNWRLNLAGLAMTAGRPLLYGLLAATDPSFIRALRAVRHPDDDSETLSQVRTPGLEMSTIIYLSQDEISINEQHKDNTSRSSLGAHMRDDTSTTPTPVADPEVGKVPANDTGKPASLDVVYHI
ncbi:hypothetical protein MSAN_01200800 [Mycena sanguinolenta]|uniref:G-protein coupled receptors family 2 profile 2 domain-containing protein n=1 Tax=Mycena sanguinolenta TaxID=230812 RepID=A0A8H6YH56_9AGAR|nr:hypothetical protein MSAN_01200800 [Mycena sanguinolenta]